MRTDELIPVPGQSALCNVVLDTEGGLSTYATDMSLKGKATSPPPSAIQPY